MNTTKRSRIWMWQGIVVAAIAALAAIGTVQASAGNAAAAVRTDRLLVGESLTAARDLVSLDGSHG